MTYRLIMTLNYMTNDIVAALLQSYLYHP